MAAHSRHRYRPLRTWGVFLYNSGVYAVLQCVWKRHGGVACCLPSMAHRSDTAIDAIHSSVLVSFTSANVSIVFQNKDAADGADVHKAAYASAQRQCMSQILSSSPKGFELQTTGSIAAPVTQTVILQRELVTELPILLVASDTNAAKQQEGNDGEESSQKPIEMSLPCSVWGFVSLLLVLDGCFTEDKILQPSSLDGEPAAAGLPLEAMEVRMLIT